ncbi:MAG TPA: magnesium transporter [Candidatus Thermoplasmatota archaeon]|nr:magnesium transporter [Candidatus Thermoplasmatota archaeon]
MDDILRARILGLIDAPRPIPEEVFEELQPFDVAEVLRDLEETRQPALLSLLPPGLAAGTLEHLDIDEQHDLLVAIGEATAKPVLEAMSDDALVDLVGSIHPRQASYVLRLLSDEQTAKVRELLTYPESSAGGRMTTAYIAVREHWTAARILDHIRAVGKEAEVAQDVYVVDRHGRLAGVTSLRDVILAPPAASVSEFMQANVIAVPAIADQEEAARTLAQYDFGALPVVSADRRLVGVLSSDDLLDVAEEEATEDIQKAASIEPLKMSYKRAGVWVLYRRRVVWLIALVVLSILSSGVIAAYESTLQAAIALAVFIPLLLASGGNTGSQSAALMMRALATQDVKMAEWASTFGKELAVGVLLGATLGVFSSLVGFLRGGWTIGLVVGLTMIAIVLAANLLGMALPFLLSKAKVDPAVASSPLVTSLTDVTGLVIYFSIATWVFASA